MPENLPQLRDIHIPPAVSEFPLGYGWWIILFIILAIWIGYKLVRLAIIKSKKLYALRLIKNIEVDNVQKSASKMSEILRRICIYKYPQALILSGKYWIDFLNSKAKTKLDEKTADLLANAPYMPKNSQGYEAKNLIKLKDFCIKWIGENL